MSIIGAIIGGAVSLIGGRKARKDQAAARADANYRNSPEGIRANAEAAGFNPLVFAGPGTGTGAQYAPVFGNEYAQAGALISDAFAQEEALKIQRSELELQNKRLEEIVKQTTLTPDVPGIYGGRNDGGSSRNSLPVAGRMGGQSGAGGTSWVAPGRDVEVSPYSSGAGLTEINNVLTPGAGIVVPGSDGEPWGIDEVATAVVAGAPQVVYQYGKTFGETRDQAKADRLMDEWFRRVREKDPVHPKFGPRWGNTLPRSIFPTQAEIDSFRYRSNVLR